MEDQKKLIKEDINFLEYPNWIVDKKSKVTSWKIERPNGKYEITSLEGLPTHLDKTVLYFLLYKLHQETGLTGLSLKLTRYEIAKNVFSDVKNLGKNQYDSVMSSLKKWNQIAINFEGVFYSNDGKSIRCFHLIDEVVLKKETGELTVRFNAGYIRQLKETKFYKFIDFEKYKQLHRATSARLYEILLKNFKERSEWAINIKKLAQKLTLQMRKDAADYYPSDILRHIKPSIDEINKKTEVYFNFQFNKDTNICIFKKTKKPKETYTPAMQDKQETDRKEQKIKKSIIAEMKSFEALCRDEQEEILDEIARDPFLEFLPDQSSRIYAYLERKKSKHA